MHPSRIRLGIAMLACAALLLGCADVPATGPTPPEFNAEFRFLHAATDLASVQVAVDGIQQGTLAFAGELAHKQFPAGSREVALSNGEKQFVAMSTNLRGTVVLLPAAAGAPREFFRLTERRLFDSPQRVLRVANFNPALEAQVTVTAGADTVLATRLAYKAVTNYINVAAGDYTMEVKAAGGNTVLATSALSISASHTSIILGDANATTIKSVTD
ncbi:MAG: hypothetical protein DKINENOH_03780 [bacterium]|nr:hypothetical protein [bacterium]MCK6557953.1 DUF4397 domain-containing protein [bacterium]NUM64015.1 DUF4397 domain-containing protein [candidate division KSB1 bacterium]